MMKVIVCIVAFLTAALLIGSIAFTVLHHDSDDGDIRPPLPIEQTVP
jgi:hypothetical protein